MIIEHTLGERVDVFVEKAWPKNVDSVLDDELGYVKDLAETPLHEPIRMVEM